MYLGERIRLYPTDDQLRQFKQFCGASRFAYNECLAYRIAEYKDKGKIINVQGMIKHLQDLKYNNIDYAWLCNVPEAITKQAIKDLDTAYKSFFKRGNKGFPKFKHKGKCIESFYQRTDKFRMSDETHIKITGIKEPVRIKRHDIISAVKNPYVVFDGRFWYFTYVKEVQEETQSQSNEIIGVDLGIKDLAVTSDNKHYANINKSKRVKQLNKRKKRLQRKLSRKYLMNKRGTTFVKTNNILKLEQELRLLDRKLANIRKTYNHTVTKDLVRTTPKAIVIEDLRVSNMLKNKHLSRSISEQGWYQIRQMLDYKCQLRGIQLIVADKFYASSKLCSCCGNKKVDLQLSNRTYCCSTCGTVIDRDYNAALNLKKYGETKITA